MPQQPHLTVQAQQPQQQHSFLGSLFQLAAPFLNAELPGAGTFLGGVGSAMNGGGMGGMASGVQQLSGGQPGGGTPPIQPTQTGTQVQPGQVNQNQAQHEQEHQQQSTKPSTDSGGSFSGASGGVGAQAGIAAKPIPDPLQQQQTQQDLAQQKAMDDFVMKHPEVFSMLQQNPSYVDALVAALGRLKSKASLGGATAQ